ncbi:competence/damage-inducible protein A [Candidatus Manganitrophus noduliformans]|nr:competence/damage-inducible protein A [Candidatus Manganitrophus noduliformans]
MTGIMAQQSKNAAIIIIGNEILSGKVQDANSPYLSGELRALGVDVQRISVIPDEIDTIGEEIAACRKKYHLVFTSGGVGPTHDDVTMEGIARGVGKPLTHHPILDQLLRTVYGGDLNPAQLKLADVPEGLELLHAEGLRVPVLRFENIYIFPGIPSLLVRKFEAIKERFRETPFHLRKIFLTGDEALVAEDLNKVLRLFPRLLLGSYPILHHPEYKVILTLESKDKAYLERATQSLLLFLPKELVLRLE